MKDYHTVYPNTGTISQKFMEPGLYLIRSIDVADPAKEKWHQLFW